MSSNVTLEEFLKPISAALGHASVPEKIEAFDTVPGIQREMYPDFTQDQIVDMYLGEAKGLGIVVKETDAAGIADAAVEIVKQFDGASVVLPCNDAARDAGLAAACEAAGLDTYVWNTEDQEANIAAAQKADAGITFGTAAIAETATVVQEFDTQTGRTIALLPISHIAVVKRSTVVKRMTQVMDLFHERVKDDEAGTRTSLPSNVTFITGPSSTSDIELVKVIGVHGPVNSGVILVND